MASSELRRLMKTKKSTSGKISHPLAKYNNFDQLICIICTKVIQDKVVWNAHLQSKKHKENVMLLKSKASASSSSTSISSSSSSSSSARVNSSYENAGKKSTSTEIPNKKMKTNLPADFFDQEISPGSSKQSINAEIKPKVIPKVPLFVETGIKSNNVTDIDVKHSNLPSTSNSNAEDMEMHKEKEVSSADRKRKLDDGESNLPEGFFDDPKKDAKARNVEYKDPKEEEWEKFQKMIQEETRVAETIQEEEDDESAMNKDMIELNKMKSCLSRVEHLKSLVRKGKQTKIQSNKDRQTIENGDDSSDDSDEDIDTMFDWRAKTLTS